MGENTNRSEPFFDEDVDLVKLQFTDIFGQCKMVQMTRRQAEKAMKEGYAINRFALGGLQKAGIEGAAAPEYLTDQSESVELYLKPDASTYQVLPWDSGQENVARVICQVCNADGTPSWTDSRHILQETVKRAEKMGLDFDFDFQCEFYLFHTDDDGRPTTVTHEVAGYYVGTDRFGRGRPPGHGSEPGGSRICGREHASWSDCRTAQLRPSGAPGH